MTADEYEARIKADIEARIRAGTLVPAICSGCPEHQGSPRTVDEYMVLICEGRIDIPPWVVVTREERLVAVRGAYAEAGEERMRDLQARAAAARRDKDYVAEGILERDIASALQAVRERLIMRAYARRYSEHLAARDRGLAP